MGLYSKEMKKKMIKSAMEEGLTKEEATKMVEGFEKQQEKSVIKGLEQALDEAIR